jgi:protein ImuA
MSGARKTTLAQLRNEIGRLETGGSAAPFTKVALGHADADLVLRGGLAKGAMHEIHAADGRQNSAATGFVLGLVQRVNGNKGFVLWVRQDFSAQENGELSMRGFAELGFDPRTLVMVKARDAQTALRVTADALACRALGVVVSEIWGESKSFDPAASRRLTLTAADSGVTALMLRLNAPPQVSTAETRWIVRAAHSPPTPAWMAWGDPVFDAALVRNRHGQTGRWIMKWASHEYLFKPQAYSQPAFATPSDRSVEAPAFATGAARQTGSRRAG